MWLDIVFVVAGIALVLFFAGRLVTGTIAFARGFGLSAFVVSVIFLGFDPENLAVGAVGAFEGAGGINPLTTWPAQRGAPHANRRATTCS